MNVRLGHLDHTVLGIENNLRSEVIAIVLLAVHRQMMLLYLIQTDSTRSLVLQKVTLCNISQSIEMLTSITGLQSIVDVLPSLTGL